MDLDKEELKATRKNNIWDYVHDNYISKDKLRGIMLGNTELNAYYKIKELLEDK